MTIQIKQGYLYVMRNGGVLEAAGDDDIFDGLWQMRVRRDGGAMTIGGLWVYRQDGRFNGHRDNADSQYHIVREIAP